MGVFGFVILSVDILAKWLSPAVGEKKTVLSFLVIFIRSRVTWLVNFTQEVTQELGKNKIRPVDSFSSYVFSQPWALARHRSGCGRDSWISTCPVSTLSLLVREMPSFTWVHGHLLKIMHFSRFHTYRNMNIYSIALSHPGVIGTNAACFWGTLGKHYQASLFSPPPPSSLPQPLSFPLLPSLMDLDRHRELWYGNHGSRTLESSFLKCVPLITSRVNLLQGK